MGFERRISRSIPANGPSGCPGCPGIGGGSAGGKGGWERNGLHWLRFLSGSVLGTSGALKRRERHVAERQGIPLAGFGGNVDSASRVPCTGVVESGLSDLCIPVVARRGEIDAV